MDDILITRSDLVRIAHTTKYSWTHFEVHDLGHPHYFLVIEFSYQHNHTILRQEKYALDILEKISLLSANYVPHQSTHAMIFWHTTSLVLKDIHHFTWIIGKLIYSTLTRPNNVYTIGLPGQFMHDP